jgi:hypothetical protein
MGGRLYSHGVGNYQYLPETERLKIRINGDAVCELDFRASYLSLFHALLGIQLSLDVDPYRAAGLADGQREAAKKWVVVSIGQGKSVEKWSKKILKDTFEKSGFDLSLYPASQIRKAMLAYYPLLASIEHAMDSKVLWARLMFIESRIIIVT